MGAGAIWKMMLGFAGLIVMLGGTILDEKWGCLASIAVQLLGLGLIGAALVMI